MNDADRTVPPSPPAQPPHPTISSESDEQFKAGREDGLDFVMDVPVDLTVEIGRRVMKIGDILRMRTGSVLELTKAAGEPLELYVNNHPIARGEPVVVGDRYGVRITEVFVEEIAGRNGSGR
jgi:flagellar motor switch protein FliN/FliY